MKTCASSTRHPIKPSSVGPFHQSGIALVFALVALVAITMATIALVRSVGTGIEIAGNMAFKEATRSAADVASETAAAWIANNQSALKASNDTNGYYANWMAGCDFTGNRTPSDKDDDVGWTGAAGTKCTDPVHTGVSHGAAISASGMPLGYSASYVITRMCFCDGPSAGNCKDTTISNSCVGVAPTQSINFVPVYDNRGLSKDDMGKISNVSPYYRIVIRVAGPRNTVSFVETMVTMEP